MKAELIQFLANTESVSSSEDVILTCDKYELSLPVTFVRMVLLYGMEFIEYYDSLKDEEFPITQPNSDEESIPKSESESESESDSD